MAVMMVVKLAAQKVGLLVENLAAWMAVWMADCLAVMMAVTSVV
jgi:hypothetical protein